MLDLASLSVLFSIKNDGPDRVRNLAMALRYFREFTVGAELILVEQGPEETVQALTSEYGAKYQYVRSTGAHYKTRNLNLAASLSRGQYIMMLDTYSTLAGSVPRTDGLQKQSHGA